MEGILVTSVQQINAIMFFFSFYREIIQNKMSVQFCCQHTFDNQKYESYLGDMWNRSSKLASAPEFSTELQQLLPGQHFE